MIGNARQQALALRLDVLVDAEEIFRIVRGLDLSQAIVVIAVGCPDAIATLMLTQAGERDLSCKALTVDCL